MDGTNVYIVEVIEQSTVVSDNEDAGVIQVVEQSTSVTGGEESVTLIEVGTQGPPGASGAGTGPQTVYDKRSDVFSDTIIYRAEADQGSLDSVPVWRIRRITINYGDQVTTTTAYPSGEQTFTFRWDQRTTYNYE